MKIDPVTYEVDVAAGTQPLYVWEAPVRIWHWIMAFLMFVMIATGFLIGAPLVSNLGDTWITYGFAYIRGIHFIAGMIFTVLFIGRLYWGVVGNRYSRMILVPPLWSLKWWKMLFEQVKYYLFFRPQSPEYAGHNPLAPVCNVLYVHAGLDRNHHHGLCTLRAGLGVGYALDGAFRLGL